MKADNTRNTFDRTKHYSGVRMQQGRVQTDADWNEQIDLTEDRIETEAGHVIGGCGAPVHDAGFALVPKGPGLEIGAGAYYVDGILSRNEAQVPIGQQPDLPATQIVRAGGVWVALDKAPDGVYLAWLDVWMRHLTALEDPAIREVALGGPDPATRAKTVWQVRLFQSPAGTGCLTDVPAWDELVAASTGKLSARATPDPKSTDPCVVAPGAGYRRLENQLYRVEVHQGGTLGKATFTWSRDNGSIVTAWLKKTGDDLTVASLGRDPVLGFAAGGWVELTDGDHELTGQPGTLVRLKDARGQTLTIDPATATGTVDLADFPNGPKVRRWDGDGETVVRNVFLPLEDGVEVRFAAGTYATGDWWLIPARTATADVEWPQSAANNPLPQPARGIRHHVCRLAMVELKAGKWTVLSDCRNLFPPLTELTALFYVSGDGQEVAPDFADLAKTLPLPQPLAAGVANGGLPVQGATVRFTVTVGNGILPGGGKTFQTATDAQGLASCAWQLDSTTPSQQVLAELLDAAAQRRHLPVLFTANLSEASLVAYDPKDCKELADAKVKTVQDAITTLCKLEHQAEGCEVVVGPGQRFEQLDTAITTLLGEGRKVLCICLLPGDYALAKGLKLEDPTAVLRLSIHGCGRGSRILPQKQLFFRSLAAFTLREVEVVVSAVPSAVVLQNCVDVEVSSCHFFGQDSSPLLTLGGAQRVCFTNNLIESYTRASLDRRTTTFGSVPEIAFLAQPAAGAPSASRLGAAADTLAARPKTEVTGIVKSLNATLKQTDAPLTPTETQGVQGLLATLGTSGQAPNRDSLIKAFSDISILFPLVPMTAVVLLDGAADATFASNTITGALGLYGDPGPDPQALTPLEIEALIKRKVELKFTTRNGALWLRGNRLTRVGLGSDLFKQVQTFLGPTGGQPPPLGDLFRTLFMTESVVETNGNFWLAAGIRLTTNDFQASKPDAGVAIAASAYYLGNSAQNDIRLFSASIHQQTTPNTVNLVINIVLL